MQHFDTMVVIIVMEGYFMINVAMVGTSCMINAEDE